MPRFTPRRDYQTFIDINKELINTVIDTVVTIHKLSIEETARNIYGESSRKVYYRPVRIPCLIRRDNTSPTLDGTVVSVTQTSEFAFLRQELQDREIYPETGDIIEFHDSYYEIVNTNETQLVAGMVQYNHAVVCTAVLTTAPATQLKQSNV